MVSTSTTPSSEAPGPSVRTTAKLVPAEVYSVADAAKQLALSESLLRKEEAAGRIRFIRTLGRATRVSAVEIARYQANAARQSLHMDELPPCVGVADYLAVVQLEVAA